MTCYSNLQMAAALRQHGVNAHDAVFLVATAHPESGGCGVMQPGQPYSTTGWGPWQITPGNSEPQCGINGQLFGLEAAACAAAAKLRSQGLSAWTTITHGLELPFMNAAKTAVSQAYRLSPSQVNALAGSPGSSGGSPGGPGAQTTGFNPLNPLGGIGGDLLGGLASALGLPSPKDMMIRLGLIMLGGLLLVVGMFMLAGKQTLEAAITVAAPESKAGQVASGATLGAARSKSRQAANL